MKVGIRTTYNNINYGWRERGRERGKGEGRGCIPLIATTIRYRTVRTLPATGKGEVDDECFTMMIASGSQRLAVALLGE